MLRTVRELQDKMKFTLSSNILGNKWKRIIRMMNETAVHWKPFGNVVILNITSHTGNTVMNDTVVCTNGHSSVGVIKQISAGGYTNFRYRLVGDNYNECYIEIMDTKTMHALEKPNEPMDINITVTTIGQTVVSFVNQYVEDHDIPTDMSVLCDTYTYQEKPRNIIYNDGAIKIEQISEDLGILHIDALINFINGELVGNTWKYYWSGVQFDKPVNYDLLSKTYDMNTSLLFHATNRSHHVTVEMSVNGFTQTFGNGQWYVHGYALVRLIHNLQKKKQQLAKIINITSFIRKYNKNIINNKEVYLYA